MKERFNSRTGMMLAMLGMAVGTGNIWRFPRIAAKKRRGRVSGCLVCFSLNLVYSNHHAGVWDGAQNQKRSDKIFHAIDGTPMGMDGGFLCLRDHCYYFLLLRRGWLDISICRCGHLYGNSRGFTRRFLDFPHIFFLADTVSWPGHRTDILGRN